MNKTKQSAQVKQSHNEHLLKVNWAPVFPGYLYIVETQSQNQQSWITFKAQQLYRNGTVIWRQL